MDFVTSPINFRFLILRKVSILVFMFVVFLCNLPLPFHPEFPAVTSDDKC